ncbi:Ankyrin repeat-containing protein [Colletotrichum asianum]
MTEVLGTVVGVVSLGIQVGSAIGAYIEGVQCRKEEVESTLRYQMSFEVLLTQIDSLKNRLLKSSISNITALEEAFEAANIQIAQLEAFLSKVLIPGHSSSLKSVRQKFRDGKKRLLYPFRRDQLDALEKKLEATNIALQSAMLVMELYGTYD